MAEIHRKISTQRREAAWAVRAGQLDRMYLVVNFLEGFL